MIVMEGATATMMIVTGKQSDNNVNSNKGGEETETSTTGKEWGGSDAVMEVVGSMGKHLGR